ncbi:hypothetical protein ACLSC7_001365 [Enterococcus hirae]|nr:hypothetical protein [Enterococcus hirae]EMF0205828.1 hypothetical protein [Enterococcus hirae]
MGEILGFITGECQEFWDVSGGIFKFLFPEGSYESFDRYNDVLKSFEDFRLSYVQALLKYNCDIEEIEERMNINMPGERRS